jgi:hypothetical protein
MVLPVLEILHRVSLCSVGDNLGAYMISATPRACLIPVLRQATWALLTASMLPCSLVTSFQLQPFRCLARC